MRLGVNAPGILAFANAHGLLDGGDAEPLDDWVAAVDAMRAALGSLSTANGRPEEPDRRAEPPGEPYSPDEARARLRTQLNDQLRGATTIQVESGFRWYVRPNSLRGALWLQLLESLSTGHAPRQCEACDGWMSIRPEGPDGKRSNKRTCSPACRVRFHEQFRRRALELHNSGVTTKKIAETLRREGWRTNLSAPADPTEQIKKWINKK